jgi:hypothetical protein
MARLQRAWQRFKTEHQGAREWMPCGTLPSDLIRRKAVSETTRRQMTDHLIPRPIWWQRVARKLNVSGHRPILYNTFDLFLTKNYSTESLCTKVVLTCIFNSKELYAASLRFCSPCYDRNSIPNSTVWSTTQ